MEQFLEQYNKIPPQMKILILVLLTAAAGYFSYMESVEPAFAAHQTALDEMDTLEKELESLNKAGQSIVAVESELRKADEDISLLLDLLPGEPEVDRVLGYFAVAAKETGVDIREFEPLGADASGGGAPPPNATPGAPGGAADGDASKGKAAQSASPMEENVTKTPIKVKLQGTFVQLVTFLDNVLGLPRVIRVTSFNFKAPSGSDKPKESGGASADGSASKPEAEDVDSGDSAPRLQAEIVFEAYSQKGMLEKFQSENNAPAPAAPAASAVSSAPGAAGEPPTPPGADASAPPPPGDAALSAKPLSGEGASE